MAVWSEEEKNGNVGDKGKECLAFVLALELYKLNVSFPLRLGCLESELIT